MRSDIMAQELREKREKQRTERRRRKNRMYSRAYRKRQKEQKRQKEAVVPKHPTLSNEEAAALEEAMGWERPPAPKQPVVEVVETSPKQPTVEALAVDPEKKRIEDKQREQRVVEHLKELQVLRYGSPESQPKLTIPAPFNLPNGIIL